MAENAFNKGYSSSKSLFDLVLRLKKVELEGRIILHMMHVSRKRMIASGVDTLLRGDMIRGAMQGNNLLSYFPFHLGVDRWSSALVPWINSWWTKDRPLIHLSEDGWFDEVF